MTAAKGNRYALRPGKSGASTKRHVVPVTEEEHARHKELAAVLVKTVAELIRELLDAKADEVLGASKRPTKRKLRA
ncbi:MAG: hypothetical protein RL685_4597 [Pseudomonadota bacterium]|jgi:hypothetical protein